MLLSSALLALIALFASFAVYGLALVRAGRARVLGGLLVAQALLGLVALWLLCTIPFGIGEPLIRVPIAQVLLQAGGALAIAGAAAGLAFLLWRRVGRGARRPRRAAAAALLLALPLVGGAGMYGLARLSLPERERERDPNLREIALSEGFSSSIYAAGSMDNPTVIAFGPEGELYIGDIAGTLWIGRDGDGDRRVEALTPWAEGFQLLVGLAWRDGELYVASAGKVEALRDSDGDDRADQRRLLVDGLPTMILMPHTNNQLAFGPDGRLYFGVGATTSGEHEPYELAANVLSVNPDGSDLKIFARGFGNTYGIAFNRAGDLFGGDNSPGAGGDNPDELNHIVEGEHYGYPYVYGDPEDDLGTQAPVAAFPAHSAPTGMAFYSGGSFPASYNDNAFITLWARGEIARVELAQTASGDYLSRVSTFASGFLYPIHAITGPDGALYVADFGTSAVYRIAYEQ